jgi:hypothetical protein
LCASFVWTCVDVGSYLGIGIWLLTLMSSLHILVLSIMYTENIQYFSGHLRDKQCCLVVALRGEK